MPQPQTHLSKAEEHFIHKNILDYLDQQNEESQKILDEITTGIKDIALEEARAKFPNTKFLPDDIDINPQVNRRHNFEVRFKTVNGCYFYGNDTWAEDGVNQYRPVEPPINAEDFRGFLKDLSSLLKMTCKMYVYKLITKDEYYE